MATRRTQDPRRNTETTSSRRSKESATGTSGRQSSVPAGTAPAGTASSSASAASERGARSRASAPTAERSPSGAPRVVSVEIRRSMIAEAAYLRSERRGFVPGFEEEDWLTAEKEVDALLTAGQSLRQ